MTNFSLEQARGVIDDRAFDRQHLELGDDAAIGGKSARLAAGGEHTMAWHHDRTGISSERLANVPRQLDAAKSFGDVAIGHGLARRDGARDIVDAAIEFRHALEIEHDLGEIVRLAVEQFDDPVDRMLHLGRRGRLRDVAMALAEAAAGLFFGPHRQLHGMNAAFAPHNAAATDRGIEGCKLVFVHGWLQILSLHDMSLMPGPESRLGDSCYPPGFREKLRSRHSLLFME